MSFEFIWSTPSARSPQVSVAEYGINFNSFVAEMMGHPKRVMIGFDEKKRVIGVKPTSGDDDTKSFEFAGRERKGYIRINNKDFVKYISQKTGINFKKARPVTPDWLPDEEILIIDLAQINDDEE